jgi:lipopolysaccharide biosynthesis protein
MRCLVLVHIFYPELWPVIAARLGTIKAAGATADVLVNCVEGAVPANWRPAGTIPGIRILDPIFSPNRGVDVGGTTRLLHEVDLRRYDLVLKLHSKKSAYKSEWFGQRWLDDFLDVCLDQVERVFAEFADSRTAMFTAAPWITRDKAHESRRLLLCKRMGVPSYLWNSPFVAGTMFWARPSLMQLWKTHGPPQSDYEEGYQQDGQLAHVMERTLGSMSVMLGGLRGFAPSRHAGRNYA